MPRIVAIDYGQKRTGIAVTDNLQMIASPLDTVDTAVLRDYLRDYFNKENVEKVIIGMPYRADGSLPPFAREIEQLADWIQKNFREISVEFVDERYTSKLAAGALVSAGVKKSKRRQKGALDKMAAAIMLQEYLGNY